MNFYTVTAYISDIYSNRISIAAHQQQYLYTASAPFIGNYTVQWGAKVFIIPD